ncbi:MAG: HAD hydrolase-like protein [Actinomycetota bacterium]|nr:HAD hydrolase-like protein [Actinomycetota bacterium]
MTNAPARRGTFDLVVFDFDGTLCDSADVKTAAFHELYLDEHGPAFAAVVRDYHLANVGLPRYDKIRYVETELLGNDNDDATVHRVAGRFSRIVEDAVVEAPLFDGVPEFLTAAAGGARLAIASATPTDELRRITDRKNISRFFAAIEGSPRSKTLILNGLISRFVVDPAAVVMVGDQPSDAEAARSAGTQGLMIGLPAAWMEPFTQFDDFASAAGWLTSRVSRTR